VATGQIPEKIYFKIGEVAKLVGVRPHVLRYWETEFPTLNPVKSQANQRLYRRADVEQALLIKSLLYQQGFTVSGARLKLRQKQSLERVKSETGALDGIIQRLMLVRDRLRAMQETDSP
jgi:DNA-binding transcriptional MerR regulator